MPDEIPNEVLYEIRADIRKLKDDLNSLWIEQRKVAVALVKYESVFISAFAIFPGSEERDAVKHREELLSVFAKITDLLSMTQQFKKTTYAVLFAILLALILKSAPALLRDINLLSIAQ